MLQTISHHTVRQYPVIVETDETGSFIVECPSFEGCFSQGETLDAALANIKEVIGICLEEQHAESAYAPLKQVGIHLVTV